MKFGSLDLKWVVGHKILHTQGYVRKTTQKKKQKNKLEILMILYIIVKYLPSRSNTLPINSNFL